MGEVACLSQWNENVVNLWMPWLTISEERYLLVLLEELPPKIIDSHPRVKHFLVSEEEEEEIFRKIVLEFLYTPFLFPEDCSPLLDRFIRYSIEMNYRASDYVDRGKQLLANFRYNLSRPTSLAISLYGKFQGIPAIICGAGPSLTPLLGRLSKMEDQLLLIGCGAGVELLIKASISPHLVVHTDPASLHQFTLSDLPLIYQLRTGERTVENYLGRRFLMEGPGNTPLESYLQKELGLAPLLDGGWNVGTLGVVLASLLGSRMIFLAGLDGVIDSSTSSLGYKKVVDRTGSTAFSRPDWILGVEWLDLFAEQNRDHQLRLIEGSGLPYRSIESVSIEDVPKHSGVANRIKKVIAESAIVDPRELWSRVEESFERSYLLCCSLLSRMGKTFFHLKDEDSILLESELAEEIGYIYFLDHIWNYWRHLIGRSISIKEKEKALSLHRLILFKSICEEICAVKSRSS